MRPPCASPLKQKSSSFLNKVPRKIKPQKLTLRGTSGVAVRRMGPWVPRGQPLPPPGLTPNRATAGACRPATQPRAGPTARRVQRQRPGSAGGRGTAAALGQACCPCPGSPARRQASGVDCRGGPAGGGGWEGGRSACSVECCCPCKPRVRGLFSVIVYYGA